jgi:aminoglycoside 3-N-acetyltransferase I
MDYHIRPISWPELEAFHGLMAVFAEVFYDCDTYLGSPPSDDYVRRLLQQDTFIALVATAGDEVVGGLAAYELRKFEQERSEIYIYDLGVKEAHRRKGVATRLIEELRSVARERGAWVVFVQADLGDDPPIELYESLGSRESVYHFDIQA